MRAKALIHGLAHATAQAFTNTGYSIERGFATHALAESHITREMHGITWSEFMHAPDYFAKNVLNTLNPMFSTSVNELVFDKIKLEPEMEEFYRACYNAVNSVAKYGVSLRVYPY
jgi:hypothetical protein